ncbi:MAG: hypothetical protein AAFZ87_03585 [Planctomycetota bacterium]
MLRLLLAVLATTLTASAQTAVFQMDFESGLPAPFAGPAALEGSQGFAPFGSPSFGPTFLRNGSGCPSAPTTLTLTGLPPHDALDLTAAATPSGFTSVQPGDTWYFQAWHRDSNPGVTSNFTDGVRVQFS